MSGGSMIGLGGVVAVLVMWGVCAVIFFLLVRLAVDKSNMRTELRHLRREVRELKSLVQNQRNDSINHVENFSYNHPEDD
ncbi:CHASE3 domain sensor protein [Paenibacillus rhizosphaerae]|uniref:CHASE3 domain sensor protein n=1 Tax=Paenibacillus rhizosphaerae TaxID=297318 RepID=A0A839U135_9BACL|nr:hypothetical protein [Paenibacillus rhizosphaerae]MBB3130597.1 CHASE3 domain sensor protein [Paenibacillus rhizosphaerae]